MKTGVRSLKQGGEQSVLNLAFPSCVLQFRQGMGEIKWNEMLRTFNEACHSVAIAYGKSLQTGYSATLGIPFPKIGQPMTEQQQMLSAIHTVNFSWNDESIQKGLLAGVKDEGDAFILKLATEIKRQRKRPKRGVYPISRSDQLIVQNWLSLRDLESTTLPGLAWLTDYSRQEVFGWLRGVEKSEISSLSRRIKTLGLKPVRTNRKKGVFRYIREKSGPRSGKLSIELIPT